MPQLELLSWFFNFILAWSFIFLVLTLILKSNSLSINSITVIPNSKPNTTNNWLWS